MDLNNLLVSYNQVKVPDRVILNILFPKLDYYFPEVELKIELRIEELKREEESFPNYYISSTTPKTTWKSPYRDKNKWAEELANSYRKAGVTNENAIKMLVALDALESGWGRSAQGKFNFGNITTGRSWKGSYVEGKDHNADGKPIKQKFRSYNSMDEYARDKVQFLKRLYDFDENDNATTFIAKLTGLNKGGRKYAESRSYATSLTKVYNSFRIGGVIKKYLNSGVMVLDNTKVVIPVKPLNIPVLPQLSYFIPDNRSDYERELSLKLAERIYNQYIEDKKTEKGLQDLNAFLTFTDYATLGLGAGNLVTKGAKLIGKRAIRFHPNWLGNELLLVKDRLRNGGFDRLLNLKGDLSRLDKLKLFGINPRTVNYSYDDYSPEGRTKLLKMLPKSGKSSDFGASVKQKARANRKEEYFTTIFDDVPGKEKYKSSSVEAHEYAHIVFDPNTLPPLKAFSPKKLPENARNYFIGTEAKKDKGMELVARGTQIKNYFGLKEGEELTEDMLRYASEHYIKDTGINNNMREFFDGIVDFKEMAKWITLYSPVTAITVINNLND